MKEKFYAEAFGEYMKRLQPYCKLQLTEAPEQRLSESPSPKELERPWTGRRRISWPPSPATVMWPPSA